MLNITEGMEKRAKKIVVYGPEGIGKSTFAACFPDALFVDIEGGTSNLSVKRIKCGDSWEELLSIVKEVEQQPDICKTLVIDTADWAEQLCMKFVCMRFKKANIEEFGYGKGYTYVQDEFAKLLAALDKLIGKDINVVVTAHAKPRKFELPEEQGAFDRWEMKLSKQVAPLLKEWCDALFFCNYKIYVVTGETGAKKATGGKRVIYTSHQPTFDAKNRFGLEEELPLDFRAIEHLFKDDRKDKTRLTQQEKLKNLLEMEGIAEDDFKRVVEARGKYKATQSISSYTDDFIDRWVFPNWEQIKNMIIGGSDND